MAVYILKSKDVWAIQWTGDNTLDVIRWLFPDLDEDAVITAEIDNVLSTDMGAFVGDYLVKDDKDVYCPCPAYIFKSFCQHVGGKEIE